MVGYDRKTKREELAALALRFDIHALGQIGESKLLIFVYLVRGLSGQHVRTKQRVAKQESCSNR